jgi:hypothetical protein
MHIDGEAAVDRTQDVGIVVIEEVLKRSSSSSVMESRS